MRKKIEKLDIKTRVHIRSSTIRLKEVYLEAQDFELVPCLWLASTSVKLNGNVNNVLIFPLLKIFLACKAIVYDHMKHYVSLFYMAPS